MPASKMTSKSSNTIPTSVINIGDEFKVSFFRVTHSIPDSFGICIDTKEGRIIDTGDFKIDLTPVGPNFELDKVSPARQRRRRSCS
jgi:mRNA degradation ribonuclease J1/J2